MLNLRNRYFFLLDLALLPLAAVLAFALRLDAAGMEHYRLTIPLFVAIAVPVTLVVGHRLGLYRRLWRYASIDELWLILAVTTISALVTAGLLFGLALPLTGLRCPRSIPILNALVVLGLVGGSRFSVRLMERGRQRRNHRVGEKRVLIMGAGDAGTKIAQEMQSNPSLGLAPVGFLDDDEAKQGTLVRGLRVLGGRAQIPAAARELRAAEVIIAMPSAPGSSIRRIVAVCQEAGVPTRTIPGMYDILSGQARVSQIREVEIEDLLRRELVRSDTAAVEAMLRGRRVLVTGGGGSIGGELCRQIARAGPECLVALGHGENSIFRIHRELRQGASGEVVTAIADIRDRPRLEWLFAQYRPELVFHAAAHKHVPLMEANVCEAISNNVLGTRNLVQVAARHGTGHFILISTDKAVNPTSVMGATKRVAELLVYEAAQRDRSCFAAVRFGNVLGSRGSVVNTFKRQIAAGGPVTVTHPEMRRFFMTIPEAVQLVLQAAALGKGGEVFVLDMGEPVRIVDLAMDLIRLSGLRPMVRSDGRVGRPPLATIGPSELLEPEEDGDWDIEVVFQGIRPGEKLHEEMFGEGEDCHPTRHEKIMVAENGLDRLTGLRLEEQVTQLAALVEAGDAAGAQLLLQQIVPEYRTQPRPGTDEGQSSETARPVRVQQAAQ